MVPTFFGIVYFDRGTLPPKKKRRALLGDLDLTGRAALLSRWSYHFGKEICSVAQVGVLLWQADMQRCAGALQPVLL